LSLSVIVLRWGVVAVMLILTPSAVGETLGVSPSTLTPQSALSDSVLPSDSLHPTNGLYLIDTSARGLALSIPLTLLVWTAFFFVARYLYLRARGSASPAVLPAEHYVKHDLLWALLIYTGLTLLYFRTCLPTFTTHLVGPPEDNMVVFWNLWWANDKVFHGLGSLTFTNSIYYPEGVYIPCLVILQSCSRFLGYQIVSRRLHVYNIIMLHSFPVAGIGAFLLARYITRNSYLALLAGFLFAFCPSHFARAQHHIHINTIQFIPFFVLYYLRMVREQSTRMLWLAALFFLLNTLADWNYMFFAGFFMVFRYLYQAMRERRIILADLLRRNAIITGCTVLVMLPWVWPMMKVGMAHPEVTYFGHNTSVVDLLGLFVPGPYHLLNATPFIDSINSSYTGNPWEVASYIGLISIVLVVVSFRKLVARHAELMLLAFCFLILGFGATLHIGGFVTPAIFMPEASFKIIPLLSNLRNPSRLIIYVYLFWSILAVVALQLLASRMKSGWLRGAVFVTVPLLLFLDYYSVKVDKTEVSVPRCYEVIEKDFDRFAILDLPLEYDPSCYYMMHQALTDIPTVNGSITRQVGKSLLNRLELNDLSKQREQLLQNQVKYIIIYKHLRVERPLPTEPYRSTYRTVYEDDTHLVLSVD